jgi:hypothetical protein
MSLQEVSMPAPTSKVWGSPLKLFWGFLASAALLAGCGGAGGTVPPPVNVCAQAFPAIFEAKSLRPGARRSGTLGPNSDLEIYFDEKDNVINAREVPPPPGTFTFYVDGFLYFPSAANVTGVTIRLTSPVFDPLLVIFGLDVNRETDPEFFFINDDAEPGDFTTSELTIPVRLDRCYLVLVQSYWAQNSRSVAPGSPGRGPYTLEVVRETSAAPPPPPPIQQKPDDRENGGGGDRGGVGI